MRTITLKAAALIVVAAAAVGTGSCNAQAAARSASADSSVQRLDRHWWQALTGNEKVDAVRALTKAYQTGYTMGELHEFRWVVQVFGDAKAARIRAHVRTPTFSLPAGAYVSEIDAFFNRNPDRDTEVVDAIIDCLSDNPTADCPWHPNSHP